MATITKIDVSTPRKALEEAREWINFQNTLPVDTRAWDQGIYISTPFDDDPKNGPLLYQDTGERCGTKFCVAGYIGQLVDPRFRRTEEVYDGDGKYRHVEVVAAEALGGLDLIDGYSPMPLTKAAREDAEEFPEETEFGYDLFSGTNSAEDVNNIIDYILTQLPPD